MILTVTANTTLDHTLRIPAFKKDGTMRATQAALSMGGKASDASFILGTLGIANRATGFKAGMFGERMDALMRERGVMTDFITVGGETRLNTILVDDSDGSMSTVTIPSLRVAPEHIAALFAKVESLLNETTVLVTGGTLPPGMDPAFYTELIGLARRRAIPVVFDGSEPFLSAGLAARPTYIKPNREELSALTGRIIHTVREAYEAGCDVLEKFGTASVITLGAEGALAVVPGEAWRVHPIRVEVVSAAGAGDCVLAGIASSILRGQHITEGLRLGVAAATATLLHLATAEVTPADVERFMPQVVIEPYP